MTDLYCHAFCIPALFLHIHQTLFGLANVPLKLIEIRTRGRWPAHCSYLWNHKLKSQIFLSEGSVGSARGCTLEREVAVDWQLLTLRHICIISQIFFTQAVAKSCGVSQSSGLALCIASYMSRHSIFKFILFYATAPPASKPCLMERVVSVFL